MQTIDIDNNDNDNNNNDNNNNDNNYNNNTPPQQRHQPRLLMTMPIPSLQKCCRWNGRGSWTDRQPILIVDFVFFILTVTVLVLVLVIVIVIVKQIIG